MTGKNTCKELKQRIRALDKRVAENQLIIDRLRRHNRNEKDDRKLHEYHINIQNTKMATIFVPAKLAEYRDDIDTYLERTREYTKIIQKTFKKAGQVMANRLSDMLLKFLTYYFHVQQGKNYAKRYSTYRFFIIL